MDTGRQTRVSSDAQEPTNTIYGQLLELPSGPQATARIRLHEDRKANISCGVSSLHAPGRWGIKPPTFCRQRLSPASLNSWAAALTACFELFFPRKRPKHACSPGACAVGFFGPRRGHGPFHGGGEGPRFPPRCLLRRLTKIARRGWTDLGACSERE